MGTFNYTDAVRDLLREIVASEAIFHHIDLRRVGISFAVARGRKRHGVLAKVVPLRFEGGETVGTLKGRRFVMPRYYQDGVELLYLLFVYFPRFQDLGEEEKLRTLFHELYHMSPHFNGDIRRFPGPNYAHGRSRKWYNSLFEAELQHFFQQSEHHRNHRWLRQSSEELSTTYEQVVGMKYTVPKLRPLEGPNSLGALRVASGRQADLGDG